MNIKNGQSELCMTTSLRLTIVAARNAPYLPFPLPKSRRKHQPLVYHYPLIPKLQRPPDGLWL